ALYTQTSTMDLDTRCAQLDEHYLKARKAAEVERQESEHRRLQEAARKQEPDLNPVAEEVLALTTGRQDYRIKKTSTSTKRRPYALLSATHVGQAVMEAAIEKSTDAGGTLALPRFQTKFQTKVTIQNSAAVKISSDNNSSDDELSDDISSDPLADLADESDPLSDESSLEVFQSRRSVAADMAHQRSGLRARVVGKSSPAFFPIQPVWHTGNNIAEGSKNPALFCLPAGSSPDSVHGSCTAIRTNLSTAWLRYQPRISHLVTVICEVPGHLYNPTPVQWGVLVLGVVAFLMYTSLVVGLHTLWLSAEVVRSVGSSVIYTIDILAAKPCQIPLIGQICSSSCKRFPVVGMVIFPTTCALSPITPLQIDLGPHWVSELEFATINNITCQLNKYIRRCSYYEAKIEGLAVGLAISLKERDHLLADQKQLCAIMRDSHAKLPDFYLYVNTLVAQLVAQAEKTDKEIEKTIDGSSKNVAIEQRRIYNEVPSFKAFLREKYDYIVRPGIQTSQRVRQGYDLASRIIEKLEEAERQNILAKMDIIVEMPLGKRLSRRYKLLQHEPKELREVRTTSDTLYDFRVEATNIRGLFLVASNNVTEVNTGLKTLVEKSYDGGENPRIGPEGILVVRTWYSGIKLRGLEIQDAISGQRATIGSNQEIKD
ncbi:MAG: hypothetical protein Q9224_005013, partial [Gallowayella concinna]